MAEVNPVICFYKDADFIFSEDYEMRSCPDAIPVMAFLESIEAQYSELLKVVQVNFEYDQKLFSDQLALYPAAKANVFILKNYQILPLAKIRAQLHPEVLSEPIPFKSLVTRNDFMEKTAYVIEQIKKGRVYQANLTAPLKADCPDVRSRDLFFHYQAHFTGHYQALLPLGTYDLLCFSPELFLQQENGELVTRPIKGSAAGKKDFQAQLIKNEKEEAELSMIVDLLRNDLNSLTASHSARVTAHRQKMQLGYIQHTYSEISIRSRNSLSAVLEKTMPGGSISGCPKIESLHVIREVEDYKRQAYTGALGWWRNNDFTLNIAIRSLYRSTNKIFYHAGCGIVYDSNPEAEWLEYLLKTGSLHVDVDRKPKNS